MIIAIDGPAGSGKSSTAKAVAQRLGIQHLDTGAMYRCITLKCLREGISHTDLQGLERCVKSAAISFTAAHPDMRVWMDGEDVTESIRSDEVTKKVSDYCAVGVVRQQLVAQQQVIGANNSVVCEGRDIGTVVFPNAELKFYMVASVEERARRRQLDFEKMGVIKTIEELIKEIKQRDLKDSTRANSPLTKAADAELIDTTNLTLEQQVEYIVDRACGAISQQ
ncbi:MAG: (d)CMP kinase [Chitinivibrionales bacterium]|nr:(d)CMP kinase [Chitinivibrionales bacterium]